MKQLMLPTLLAAGLALGAQAAGDFTIQPLSGTVEQKRLGDEIVLTVRSNSQLRVTGSGKIDILLIGGGGGGRDAEDWGTGGCGGGGGGGFVYRQSLDVTAGTTNIVIGAGGTVNANGGNSFAFGLTAYGGGRGGYGSKGADGASGGGGGSPGYQKSSPATYAGGAAIYGDQGYPGGAGTNRTDDTDWRTIAGGGGGGAGGAGKNAATICKGGAGGPGRSCDITGTSVVYGGGGGGFSAKYNDPGLGGSGGGGNGASCKYIEGQGVLGVKAGNGTDWLGGGGGGSSRAAGAKGAGGRGGSGVVIIRYTPKSNGTRYNRGMASGGNMYVKKHYQFHSYTNSSTFVLPQAAFVDMLVVGGGGGGGGRWCAGGGGGAGGVGVYSNVFLSAGTYAVTVGAGGAGAQKQLKDGSGTVIRKEAHAQNGGASSVVLGDFERIVQGGGAGGSRDSRGNTGASGGGAGAGYPYNGAQFVAGGAGREGFGHNGGGATNESKSVSWEWCICGGGGGAGAPGVTGARNGSTATWGDGGDGVCLDFTGKDVWYAGGGGGGASKIAYTEGCLCSKGGKGGGGAGAATNSKHVPVCGRSAEPNTGGGGGGCGGYIDTVADHGGDGGSGIVVIRYRVKKPGLLVELRCK